MDYDDKNLEFIIRNIPDKNFINIIKNSGGLLGSPAKRINYQYRNFLINRLLKKKIPLKVKKAIFIEIKRIATGSSRMETKNSSEKAFQLLCLSYLEKKDIKITKYKQTYTELKNSEADKKTKEDFKGDTEKTHFDKVIEKQKRKIKSLNEEYQTSISNERELKRINKLLKDKNQMQESLVTNQKKKIEDLRQEVVGLKKKKKEKEDKSSAVSLEKKRNEQLLSKIHDLEKNITNLKSQNLLIKKDNSKLQEKLIRLTFPKYLLIGMPMGFKYGSIKVPKNVIFQIAVTNAYGVIKDKEIINYSSIDDMINQLQFSIDKYTKILVFNGEVTRRDIIELSTKVNKNKIDYIHSMNELEWKLSDK